MRTRPMITRPILWLSVLCLALSVGGCSNSNSCASPRDADTFDVAVFRTAPGARLKETIRKDKADCGRDIHGEEYYGGRTRTLVLNFATIWTPEQFSDWVAKNYPTSGWSSNEGYSQGSSSTRNRCRAESTHTFFGFRLAIRLVNRLILRGLLATRLVP